MLEQLFGSKTRVHLLRLFLAHQNESFYVRELTRRIGAQINAVRNELENLESMGIIKIVSEIEANQNDRSFKHSSQQRKYYRLDTEAVLYLELRALFAKSGVLLERQFMQKLNRAGRVQYLALLGHFVGDYEAETDIFIIGNLNKDKVTTAIRDFERAIGREINYTMMTPNEFRYRKDLTDRFLYNVLNSKKIILLSHLTQEASLKEVSTKTA
jgi:DNA-binding transcriptional ArsR family regulator